MLASGLLGCLVAGVVVPIGGARLAVALVTLPILAALIVLERQRMALILWMGVALTAPLQGVRVAPILTLSDVLIVAAFVTIIPDVLPGWRRVVPTGVVIAFGLLVSAGLVGTFFAPDVGASVANLVKIILAAAGSIVTMALWDPGAARLRRFAWFWFAGATASAGWAAITPRSFVGRAYGLTNHPNHFGLVCVLATGLGIGLALSSTGRSRVAALSGIALLIAGVGLSGSRSALLALAVTVALTAVLTHRFRLLVSAGLAIVLAAVAVIVGVIKIPDSHALSRLGGGGGSAASDLARKQILAEALNIINRHPFTGEGFEFAEAAHNIYLQALVVGGPLALLGFLCVSGLIVRAGFRASLIAQARPEGPLLAGLTAGYVGYLFSGAFDNILWDRYLWTFIGLLLLLSASSRPARQLNARAMPKPAGPPLDAALIGVAAKTQSAEDRAQLRLGSNA